MHKRASSHLQFLVFAFLACFVVGLVSGHIALSIAIPSMSYVIWSVYQSIRLHRWLYKAKGERSEIPESYGLWGDMFDGLYQLQQKNTRSKNHLKALIQRVQTSTNALREAVVMTDKDGHMEWWNEASKRLFGFREQQDIGQLITNLIRDPEFKKFFASRDYDSALDIASPFDPNILLRVKITSYGEDDRLIIAQDITRIHQLEQMRRDFVSNVSHEMRTPLTVIRGYIETLLDFAETPKKLTRPLNSMADQTRRLEVLVSDLLLLEKYETQDRSNKMLPVDLPMLLESICQDARMLSGERSHNILLDCETDDLLIGEENQLRSAFSNLIYNAVKYTPDDGNIEISWYRDSIGGHLVVKDDGCGFDPIHIPRLTERFYRADPSRNNDTGGSGLGLAIVKHVLINHHGTLEIKSRPDVGSEFSCHFPNTQFVTRLLPPEQKESA